MDLAENLSRGPAWSGFSASSIAASRVSALQSRHALPERRTMLAVPTGHLERRKAPMRSLSGSHHA